MHYLSQYQTFENKQQLNESIYQHIKQNSYELNETDRATLKAIARYAVKFAGVAHLKAATIAELISKSEKTARRVIAKLANLGILRKVPTTRKVNGGKGANIIQILSLPDVQSSVSNREQAVKRTESKAESVKCENEPSDSIKLLKDFNSNTYHADKSADLQRRKVSTSYGQFRAMVNNFVKNRKLTNRLYGVYLAQIKHLRAYEPAELLAEGIEALRLHFS
ncbi:helix-turn-helix domain-containing protein [Peribacillus asahii]|uniref:helix-turn-helix domain-containing protein n=1 Tax=Peribacillus asahii TaxID=228899 RepID=UPI0038090BB1